MLVSTHFLSLALVGHKASPGLGHFFIVNELPLVPGNMTESWSLRPSTAAPGSEDESLGWLICYSFVWKLSFSLPGHINQETWECGYRG